MSLPQTGLHPVRRPWTDRTQAPNEIRWNRVYTLPDFVRFSHQPHIHAAADNEALEYILFTATGHTAEVVEKPGQGSA